MDIKKAKEILSGEKYYTAEELRFNKKYGMMLSKTELDAFYECKEILLDENDSCFIKIPLKTFNSNNLYYHDGSYLSAVRDEYLSTLDGDFSESVFTQKNLPDILVSRVFSEVEGTLNIENVPTTHKRIRQIYNSDKLIDKNDIIIKNMLNAIFFVLEEPEFNKENLFKLYNILSTNCLDDEDKLKDGLYYRDDDVSVGGYDGVYHEKIEEYMDGLFWLVNDKTASGKLGVYLPHICHYYVLYLHPYFDYNGRTARMVSLWISLLKGLSNVSPLFMSEAINDNKQDYYKALINSRNTGNDLTYFLGYIFETATKYSLVYKNVEGVKKELADVGSFMTASELIYLKKILVHNADSYFNYKMFMSYCGNNMTKQAALKILRKLTDYGIINETQNKKNETIFKVNQDMLKYVQE